MGTSSSFRSFSKTRVFNHIKEQKKKIKNFVDLETAMACEYLIIAIPAQQIRAWMQDNFVFKGQKILVASKGIEASTGKFLNEIYKEFVPSKNVGFISGPSFAAEVIKGLPAAIVINSKFKKTNTKNLHLFSQAF